MPTLNIEGQKVTVDDSFLKLSPEEQSATVDEIAGSLKINAGADKPAAISATDVARSAASGVPIIGGLLNKANAATNAALAPVIEPFLEKGPDTLDQPSFGERYSKSLDIQNKRDAKFAKEHPVVDTAAKIGGGVASLAPVVAAAPLAMGAAGTVPQMVVRGAASGAGISAADAVTRGTDIADEAGIGAITGAAGGPVGKIVGKAVSAVLPKKAAGPPLPAQSVHVAGVDVPIPPSDVDAAQTISNARKGVSGAAAQTAVQGSDAEIEAALRKATENIGTQLDTTGAGARPSPQAAAERVASELSAAEQTRFQTEQARTGRAAAEGDQVRGGLATDPYTGQPLNVADTAFSGAEAVGGGVEREAAAARGAYQRRYKAAGEAPGEFQPGAFRDVPEDIRARLSAGDEPVIVDDVTTPFANKALRDIETNVGLGNFQNAAAPAAGVPATAAKAPVTPAAAAAVSPAREAYDELIRRGAAPERARAVVANIEGAADLPAARLDQPVPGAAHSVSTATGRKVDVIPRVAEADAIKTSADAKYDPALQPRNRKRTASDAQINDIAKNLDPQRLGHSAEADRGAPIIGPDGMIESGNGRVLAIRKAYEENGPAAARYREWLAGQGVDVAGFKKPVLVRERTTALSPADRKAFTVEANQSSTLSLSAPERALADSRALTPETLGMIRNPGDLGAVENRDFVRQFMQSVPKAEHGALTTGKGDLSAEGLTRVRNAVLAKAYGDSPVLTRLESTSDDIRSISSGLQSAAPEWAQLRAGVARGAVPKEMDITADLLDAVERTARLRSKGASLAEGTAQREAFGQQSPESESLMRLFYGKDGKSAAPSSQIGNALRDYAQQAGKVDAAPGLDLGLKPVTPADILANTARKVEAPKALAADVIEAAKASAAPVEAALSGGRPVDMRAVDNARKRLLAFAREAKAAAPGKSDYSDVRAMSRVMSEFDKAVSDRLGSKFSGDPEVQRLWDDARSEFAKYAQAFRSRGGRDEVGGKIEKILGRFPGQQSTPAEIAQMSYGSISDPGGGAAIKIAQRLRQIVGPTSPEWGGYKQGLFSYLVDRPEGGLRPAAEAADRVEKFLSGTQGRGLSHVAFSGEERAAMATYAQNLRASEPVPLSKLGDVEKIVARITGRDGGLRAGTDEIVSLVMGAPKNTGARADAIKVGQRLKKDMSPEGFDQVRHGLWQHLTERPPGVAEWSDKVIAENIYKFLDRDISKVYFTAPDRAAMKAYADARKAQIPPAGAVNTSNTTPTLVKAMKQGSRFMLPLLGLAHGGVPGAIVGEVGQRALSAANNARAAREVKKLLYQPEPTTPIDPRFAKAGALLTRGAMQGQISNR